MVLLLSTPFGGSVADVHLLALEVLDGGRWLIRRGGRHGMPPRQNPSASAAANVGVLERAHHGCAFGFGFAGGFAALS